MDGLNNAVQEKVKLVHEADKNALHKLTLDVANAEKLAHETFDKKDKAESQCRTSPATFFSW